MKNKLLTPSDLGLDPKHFPVFRTVQTEVMEFLNTSPTRVTGACVPTGAGKTAICAAVAVQFVRRTKQRVVILVATKAQQEEYTKYFSSLLVSVTGKANYTCVGVPGTHTCKSGGLEGCPHFGEPTCLYDSARDIARNANIVVTNYAYWLRLNSMPNSPGLCIGEEGTIMNPFGLLIMDEADTSFEQLAGSMHVEIHEANITSLGVLSSRTTLNDSLSAWVTLAKDNLTAADSMRSEQVKRYKRNKAPYVRELVRRLEGLCEAFESIQGMDEASWICESHGDHGHRKFTFDAVWPGMRAESRLFLGIPQVFMLSATLRRKTMGLLGLKAGSYSFKEWPRVFPKERSPVYRMPGASMSGRRITDAGLRNWVSTIDKIIDARLDRKGIIHTSSYARQQYLVENSRHAVLFHVNKSEAGSPTSVVVADGFRAAKEPAILVSPSFTTGWNFPGRECEYQIIAKVPFKRMDKVNKARAERDPGYSAYATMQEIVQMCGRGMRFPLDRCETFIVDDDFDWFYKQARASAPEWFEYRLITKLPMLPERAPETKGDA